MTISSSARFGELLLELSSPVQELSIEQFRQHIFEVLQRYIRFDVAWWALVVNNETIYHVHSSFQMGLPSQCEELLNRQQDHNIVALRSRNEPDKAFVFGPDELYGNLHTAMLARHMGVYQVAAIGTRDETLKQNMFLSIARRSPDHGFSEDDRQLLELLIPHIRHQIKINLVYQVAHWHARRTHRIGVAIVDAQGLIHTADQAFIRLLEHEWVGWRPPKLPEALIELSCKVDSERIYVGKLLVVNFSPAGSLALVTLSQRCAVDLLTPRERTVAVAYAHGQSYKEVARELSLSPATVRHHLRNAYQKLGVSDKAELATLLHGSLEVGDHETTDV